MSQPVAVAVPEAGVMFAESVHAQDFAMSPRAETFHKLVYVLRGAVSYREEGREVESVGRGELIVVPASARHALADEETSTLLLLCVGKGFLRGEADVAEVWRALTERRRRRVAVHGPARAQLENCWRRALVERAQAKPAAGAATRALALQVFVQLGRLPTSAAGAEDAASRVATVAREMEQTFFERWTIDAAAGRAGMSRRHFTAQFRAVVGQTFWARLTELRLTQAAALLARGDHSVAGVIFACGFGDVSQFYRLFRARFGKTPGAARRG